VDRGTEVRAPAFVARSSKWLFGFFVSAATGINIGFAASSPTLTLAGAAAVVAFFEYYLTGLLRLMLARRASRHQDGHRVPEPGPERAPCRRPTTIVPASF
jgi:hypothetical protein